MLVHSQIIVSIVPYLFDKIQREIHFSHNKCMVFPTPFSRMFITAQNNYWLSTFSVHFLWWSTTRANCNKTDTVNFKVVYRPSLYIVSMQTRESNDAAKVFYVIIPRALKYHITRTKIISHPKRDASRAFSKHSDFYLLL